MSFNNLRFAGRYGDLGRRVGVIGLLAHENGGTEGQLAEDDIEHHSPIYQVSMEMGSRLNSERLREQAI